MTRREELDRLRDAVQRLADSPEIGEVMYDVIHMRMNIAREIVATLDALISMEKQGQEQSARFDENNLDVVQLMGVRE